MYNNHIMTKRYTKHAYKKRRTVRKSRVNRRKTQRGGFGLMGFMGSVAKGAAERGMSGITDKIKGATSAISTSPMAANIIERGKSVAQSAQKSVSGISAGTVVLTVTTGLITALTALGKAMFSLIVMLYIAKTYISNPAEAKRLMDAKADQVIKDNPKAANCVKKLQEAIALKINQNIVSKNLPSPAAAAGATASALSASIDKIPSLFDLILAKKKRVHERRK